MKTKVVLEKYPHMLYGADYNPEQWLDRPDILEEDIRLMKKAGVNSVSVGIFSWANLEPEEGVYNFDYMEELLDRLADNGIYAHLSTPSGAMPNWLTGKYPEVLQTDNEGVPNIPGKRHNFCYTSPIMREKTRQINEALAKRFGNHKAVIEWHVSNEYGGNFRDASCHCENCQKAFRQWLKDKYQTLDNLNHAWWSTFWAHTVTDWEQIHSPNPHGEDSLHGLNLDWRRFVSSKLQDFAHEEIQALRRYSSLPVTVNMMYYFEPLNYKEWSKEVDIISWDAYPEWHSREDEIPIATWVAAMHDKMRSFKKAPFILMESTPSVVNWRDKNIVKRPGMNYLSSMQAVAHGANAISYFQWRKSRGSFEKFHGAVVGHDGGSDNRVFEEVARIGEDLGKIDEFVYRTCNESRVAIIFDWENWWALKDAQAITQDINYVETMLAHYRIFWEKGISVDLISMDDLSGDNLSAYDLVVAPILYMSKAGYIENMKQFVANGGTYVGTYWSNRVDETDLCFLGEKPLESLMGVHVEDIDCASEFFTNALAYKDAEYALGELRETVTAKTAEVLGTYTSDYSAGTPAFTVNHYGEGHAYYIAAEGGRDMLMALYEDILISAGVKPVIPDALPYGVTVTRRVGDENIYFLQNFNRTPVSMHLSGKYENVITKECVTGDITLDTYACIIMREV